MVLAGLILIVFGLGAGIIGMSTFKAGKAEKPKLGWVAFAALVGGTILGFVLVDLFFAFESQR